mmetsp:Transcript_2941/g.7963  ORF Transcript_2941/g.7963 Transcript_2941/m.7963 type:complete len:218 (-) Transcript_2941:654-1307(-)
MLLAYPTSSSEAAPPRLRCLRPQPHPAPPWQRRPQRTGSSDAPAHHCRRPFRLSCCRSLHSVPRCRHRCPAARHPVAAAAPPPWHCPQVPHASAAHPCQQLACTATRCPPGCGTRRSAGSHRAGPQTGTCRRLARGRCPGRSRCRRRLSRRHPSRRHCRRPGRCPGRYHCPRRCPGRCPDPQCRCHASVHCRQSLSRCRPLAARSAAQTSPGWGSPA